MELRHEPSSHITNLDTIRRGLFFYTRKEAADYAKSIGWPKSSARLVNLPHGRQRWAISDDHLNIVLQDCNPHELGFCCRYASGQTCVGCGDASNGHELSQEQIESELDLKVSEGLV